MARWAARKEVREMIVLLFVVVSLCFSIVYIDVQTYDPILTPASGYTDTIDYIKMYKRDPEVRTMQSLRIVVPLLARAVPDLPQSLFASKNRLLHSEDLKIAIKFAVVNLFLLIGACIALYVLQRGFDLNFFQALLGVVLFLSSTTVVRAAGLPMTDAGFYFFFLLCLIAIQRNNWWFLLWAYTIGIITKELVLLSVPLIFLSLLPLRRKLILLSALIPAIIICFIVLSGRGASSVNTPLFQIHVINAQYPFSINCLVKMFLSFGLLWIPALYALKYGKGALLLRRWSWFIVIVIVGSIVFAGNLDRNIFVAFPVVIPLAVCGLSQWVDRGFAV